MARHGNHVLGTKYRCLLEDVAADLGKREAIGGRPNVTVTEGRNGEGVYEAVVSTLAEGR